MPISFDKEKFKSGVSSVRSKSGSAKGKMDSFRAKWNGDKSAAQDYGPVSEVESRPLKSLPDPKTFAPPPKHREWYGDEVSQQSLAVAKDAQYVQQPARATPAAPVAAQPPAPAAYQPAAPAAAQPAAYQAVPAPPPRAVPAPPAAGGPPLPGRPVPAPPAAAAAPAAYQQPAAYQPAATPAPPPRDQPPSYDNLAAPQTPSRPPPMPARPGVPTQPYGQTPPASDPNVYAAQPPAAAANPAAASTPAGINFAAQIAGRRSSAASSVSDITSGMAQTAIGKKKPPPPLPKKKPGLAGKPVPGAKPVVAAAAAVPASQAASAVEAALGAQTYSKAPAFVPPPSGKPVDTQMHTQWFVNDQPPPDLQGLGWTSQFSSSGGTTTKIYAFRIPEDLSIIKLRIIYPTHNPAAATCERKDVPPPRELTPGELYEYNLQYGDGVARWAESMVGTQVGDGECWTLAKNAIEQSSQTALVSQAYTHGALIYQQNGSSSNPANIVKNVEAIRRGDILQFYEAKFESRSAGGFSSSSYGVPNHTAVVVGVSEGQRTVYILHQNTGGSKIVQQGQIELADMTSGELKAYRVVGAEWAGQLDCSM
ncbi:Altered inheritance of mitochondria protein 3 [Yarrowia sp. B02]|nr:Altered inheritance of mitochondria protein 3 [Yarrowia sp. B02]